MDLIEKKILRIDLSIAAAKLFIQRAEEWRRILVEDPEFVYGCKQGGAAKRASMELTNALVILRKAT